MTAYSITPEGATEAAKEIVDSEWTCCHANPATVTELAAIILRHAEQSTEETCVHCGTTRDVHGLISAAAASCAFESTQSSEGEMRTGMKTPWCLNGHEVLTPGCESCLLDLQKRYNDALRKVQGEGEMREALLAYEEAERHMRVGLCDTDCAKATKLLTAAHELAQKALGPAGREEKP